MVRTNRRLAALLAGMALVIASPAFAEQSARGAHGEEQREAWQKVGGILEAMQVRPGAVVADVGAGDGFFTKRLAGAVGAEGRVFAVDVGADALRRLRKRVADEALSNVEVIEGAVDDPKLPAASIDAALIVNAYHEMTEHQAMLTKIRAALKPGGRLVIVEPISRSRRDSRRDEQTRNHEIAADFVREDARAAGFTQVLLQDPFTSRPQGQDEEWILVLTPAGPATGASQPGAEPAQVFSSNNDDWKAPELRIPVDEFKRLAAAGGVLVLDVRDPQSYQQGHLPGALLMTPEELSKPEGAAKLKGERRLIVAYCS
ncbi:MAG TPA: methyltransferase domain-containing protein [Vicinamibacterales bacterium]|nr:methyltransferase domain-containing protein [Vicinamibacterales bacterium]